MVESGGGETVVRTGPPTRSIIIIDDDPDSLEMLSDALELQGFDALPFSDPIDAMQQCLWLPPDAIVLDFDMPRMNGLDFVKELASQLGKEAPPMIMLSGAEEESVITEALKYGAMDYLVKPAAIGLLCAKLRQATTSKRNSRSVPALDRIPKRIGRYIVIKELGRGGMGVVYKAIHPNQPEPVAIKTMIGGEGNLDGLLRFRREIDLLVTLNHPNLIQIHDTGRSRDVFYYVMEYIAGQTLRERINRGPASAAEIARVLHPLAGALAHIHAQGLVHRDLKPSNVLFCPKRGPILSDFGLSKSERDHQLTGTNQVVGTPHFMSPEMIRGDPVDSRADLFSLGMIALEMLLGADLIPSDNSYTVMRAVADGDFPHASRVAEITGQEVPRAFISVVDRLVALAPQDRYEDGWAVQAALEPFLEEG